MRQITRTFGLGGTSEVMVNQIQAPEEWMSHLVGSRTILLTLLDQEGWVVSGSFDPETERISFELQGGSGGKNEGLVLTIKGTLSSCSVHLDRYLGWRPQNRNDWKTPHTDVIPIFRRHRVTAEDALWTGLEQALPPVIFRRLKAPCLELHGASTSR